MKHKHNLFDLQDNKLIDIYSNIIPHKVLQMKSKRKQNNEKEFALKVCFYFK